jgi:hypothetical protein
VSFFSIGPWTLLQSTRFETEVRKAASMLISASLGRSDGVHLPFALSRSGITEDDGGGGNVIV